MSLSTALSIAQSTLLNTSRQTTVVSRNVSEGSNPNYARRSAILITAPNGAQVIEVRRATNEVLFRQNLGSTSSAAGQTRLLSGMDSLNIDVYGVEHSNSPATVIGQFMEAMQVYSSSPSNLSVAENAIASAKQVVSTLNSGTQAIQAFRTNIDREIVGAVSDLNRLLADFKVVNDEVVTGTKAGRDVNDALDQRDGLLKKISEFVPISTIQRSDNDLMLVTKAGTTLFETQPREVSFTPTAGYSAGTDGNTVTIDGVPLAIGGDASTSTSGTLAAMLQLRDGVAGGMQAQLDEIARGLINAFAETDPNGVQPDAAGLFTWPGAPALPAAGTLVDGLAGSISVNAAFDTSQGGDPRLLRDGGANGADYIHNTSGGSGYSDLLIAYADKLNEPIVFDSAAGIDATVSVVTYSTESVSWFGSIRQDASRAAESSTALMMHTTEVLSNATGVNIDEELTLLLDLEHTYEASARLLRTIDEMLAAVMNAV
jgi:flagellar hook-associated protein 1 FlgK